jgi:hypothetical protein
LSAESLIAMFGSIAASRGLRHRALGGGGPKAQGQFRFSQIGFDPPTLNFEHFLRRTGLHFGGKCSRERP